MENLRPAVGVACLLFVAIPVFAQSPTPSPPAESESDANSKILNDIHNTDLAEIKMAQIAVQHAMDKDVKTFAQHMIRDHQATEKALEPLAQKENVALAETMVPGADEITTRLQSLTDKDFDLTFLSDASKDHQKALDTLGNDRAAVKDKTVLAFVEGVEKVVKKHKAKADKLLTKYGERQNTSGTTR
jgi:putative membrane protein